MVISEVNSEWALAKQNTKRENKAKMVFSWIRLSGLQFVKFVHESIVFNQN